jgi:hypothetical protein
VLGENGSTLRVLHDHAGRIVGVHEKLGADSFISRSERYDGPAIRHYTDCAARVLPVKELKIRPAIDHDPSRE